MEEHVVEVGRLRLVWWRPADRWRHRLEVTGDAGTEPPLWAETVEGSSADEWPASPAFQDLFLESKEGGAVEFQLMGQCGRTIYSAAILCDPSQKRIDFDICARTRRAPLLPGLVSTYRLLPAGSGAAAVAGPPFVVADDGQTSTNVSFGEDRWTVGHVPPLAVDAARGTLYRWRYAVVCE